MKKRKHQIDETSIPMENNMSDLDIVEDDFVEPETWTIVEALNRVLELAEDSELNGEFWEKSKNPLAYLREALDLTDIQIIVLAIMIEAGEPMSWRKIAEYLNCSRLSVMVYTEEIDKLVEKRWIHRRGTRERYTMYEGFALERGVVTALRHNKTFIPEKIDGLSTEQFIKRLERHFEQFEVSSEISFSDEEEWMMFLHAANPNLPLCSALNQCNDDIHVKSLFFLVLIDYYNNGETEDEGVSFGDIERFYDSLDADIIHDELANEVHPLIIEGLIESKCEDGMANMERYVLTRKCKDELLEGFEPNATKRFLRRDNRLKRHTLIRKKEMYYNSKEQEQVDRLTSLLSKDNFSSIQKRLSQEGMRKGFACLFYGDPGTGKTETVMQIARRTGRDIMQIDIAGMRDKYVGESEKNIKSVFNQYRKICKNSNVTPILFFNEADGIFGKRSTNAGVNPSVEKMDNAMQNIILQEMEDLDGILIATTNLTCNLDAAFERRYLFKIEFHNPETDIKVKLWRSMLGDSISDEDAMKLAKKFDFSGGQIENIARQRTIDYILSGKKATFEDMEKYCQSEYINNKANRRAIGFAS